MQNFSYLGASGGTWRTTPVGAIRSGDWKLLEFFEDGRLELYNLKNDPGEKTSVLRDNGATAEQLHAQLITWRKEVQAPMPTPRKPNDGNPKRGKGKSAPQSENAANDS